MLGSRLARRIVPPLLLLHAALFGLLAWVAVGVADARVAEELDEAADRVARTLDEIGLPPEHRAGILAALARLVDCEVVVGGHATDPLWRERDYRALERPAARGGGRYTILFHEAKVARRRSDALAPVLWTGSAGLLVAFVLGIAVARRIALPVKRLSHEAHLFASGERVEEGGARGPGEIGDLEAALAAMRRTIREGEQRLRESERLAALGRLAGGIAHELRNPLTAIRMAVETATGPDGPGRAEARRIALGEIDRLDRTLRELLDFVRPRQPRKRDFALRDLVADVVALLKPQCDHLRVGLTGAVEGDPRLCADYDRVKQALLNLVLNGAQAQPAGGFVRLRAEGGRLSVEDQGPGIPEEVRERLWEPFVTTRAAGIGLGLAVVKQIADEHGAAIDFRTGAKGTTFTLRFPGA